MSDSISLLIAGHKFRVVGDKESALLRTMPGFPVFESEYDDPEWQVVFGRSIAKPAHWDVLYDFVFEADIMTCTFAKTKDTYYFAMEPYDKDMPPLLMRYVFGEKVIDATVCIDPDMLRFALWMAYGLLASSSCSMMTARHSQWRTARQWCMVHRGAARHIAITSCGSRWQGWCGYRRLRITALNG